VQSVELAVPFAPVTFKQGDDYQLVYELHITNFQSVDVALRGVRINGPARVLADYRDADLQHRIVRPGLRHDHATPHIIGPGMRAVVNFWLAVPDGAFAPASLTHTVELDVQRPQGPVHAVIEGGAAAVSFKAGVTLDAPLRGGQWVAIYDPLLKGGHRTAIYTLGGRARIPGRFAIDFITLPPDGALPRNPAHRSVDGNGFGTEVVAVADAVVAAAVDGMADHMPQPVALEIASGNYVSIDLGGGRLAFYEHLQRGSVLVKAGQRVRRGDVIARLGASGSTSIGPHLHFHVADANSLLEAEGMPFVFRNFTVLGQFASITALMNGEKWLPSPLARPAEVSRPLPNSVIAFPSLDEDCGGGGDRPDRLGSLKLTLSN
jgi:murein DD-endopeptidase